MILTALETEHAAIRQWLSDVQCQPHRFGTMFEVGRIPDVECPVVLALAGDGNTTVATITERAISTYAPAAVLFVGVAGALHDDIGIGDVVVPTRVYAYHGGREGIDGFGARPRAWEADHGLIQLARYVSRTTGWADPQPSVHFRPIAAGAVLLDNRTSPTAQQIRRHYQDAAAIEMESAGLAQAGHLAARCPVLPIRGISDQADGHKATADRAGSQPTAATNAAAFAVAFMRHMSKPSTPRRHPATPSAAAPPTAQDPTLSAPAGTIVPRPRSEPATGRTLRSTPAGEQWQRGRRIILFASLTFAMALVIAVASTAVWPSGARSGAALMAPSQTPSGPVSKAADGPIAALAQPGSPTEDLGIAAMAGTWTGVLHYPHGDPEYYPMQITLHAGRPTQEVGESRYSKQNCRGKLILSGTSNYGFMLTEDIQEPRGPCSKISMYFTVKLMTGGKLEIKYWWAAVINSSSLWYADAALERSR